MREETCEQNKINFKIKYFAYTKIIHKIATNDKNFYKNVLVNLSLYTP